MHATWDFLKRHRGKIVAGTAIVGTLYSTKKLLETEMASVCFDTMKKIVVGAESPADEEVEECLAEARRHFLFDVHQQSCDKALRKVIPELKLRIADTLNTEKLLDELRSSPNMSPQRKIEIWEHLKVYSVSLCISLMSVFPLTILVLKSQKAIICQQLCHSVAKRSPKGNSLFNHGIRFVNSFLFSDQTVQPQSDLNGNLTQLFNNSLAYFMEDGVSLLIGVIERIVRQTFDKVSLGEQFNANDLLFLIERVRAKMEEICGEKYADFVVPISQVSLENYGAADNARLRILLKHLTELVNSRDARHLMKEFGDKYLEDVMKFLDEMMIRSKVSVPLAKIVPILCDAFAKVGTTDHGSTFHTLLTSTELHRYTLFVSDCSKYEFLLGVYS